MKKYELIEHTADIGIKVRAATLKGLFKNAAFSMFDIMAERRPKTKGHRPKLKATTIEQKAESIEELFVNWLNDLLSLSAAKELIFSDFKIKKINNHAMESEVRGEDIKNYRVNTEIKAATYHELKLAKAKAGWEAEVIFDV